MARNYNKVAEFLEHNFPELQGKIEGGNYPPPPIFEFVANIVTICQLIGLAWMVMGPEALFRMVGMQQPPSWANTLNENAIQLGILLFLLLPQMVGRYTQTGAFELYLDGETVFSKLAEGRFPNGDELLGLFRDAGLKFKGA